MKKVNVREQLLNSSIYNKNDLLEVDHFARVRFSKIFRAKRRQASNDCNMTIKKISWIDQDGNIDYERKVDVKNEVLLLRMCTFCEDENVT